MDGRVASSILIVDEFYIYEFLQASTFICCPPPLHASVLVLWAQAGHPTVKFTFPPEATLSRLVSSLVL